MMILYRNLNGDSGVISYETTEDSIHVVFKSGTCRNYLYNSVRLDKAMVEKTKALAAQGYGLNSYISSFVRDNYARK